MSCNYPNLMAEIEYSGVSLRTLADHANVTDPVMHDILNGKDDLSMEEAERLYRLFKFHSIPNDEYDFDYLFDRELKVINAEQTERFQQISEYYLWKFDTISLKQRYQESDLRKIKSRVAKTEKAENISYAQYRHCLFNIFLLDALVSENTGKRTTKLTDVKEKVPARAATQDEGQKQNN